MESWAGIVLAAGKGTRMKSSKPKVLHTVCGQALIKYPVEALKGAGVSRIVVVVSPETGDLIKETLGESVEYVYQNEPLGTGNALLQASAAIKDQAGNILVLGSDSPLITASTLSKVSSCHTSQNALVTLLSAHTASLEGMGRILRGDTGKVTRIVEASQISEEDGDEAEVNSGVYGFKVSWLWKALPKIDRSPGGEFYITSLVEIANNKTGVETVVTQDPDEVIGINNRVQLAHAEGVLRQRIREGLMLSGVTMLDPASILIDSGVEIGEDTVIYPNTLILGNSTIGANCTLGPGAVIRDSILADNVRVVASFLEEATVEETVAVGPFSRLRPGTHLERGVHIGSFSEIKNSRFASGAVMGHFGYVGDATIGKNVNIGAGTVTCNFDGVSKHRTLIEDDAFIGSDSMLVAPVTVGEGATTGAGSVVTDDVPPHRLAVGVPAKIKELKDKRPKE